MKNFGRVLNIIYCINISNTLLNNLYLLYNYYNYQFDENLINIIKDNIILNDLNFVDNTFYNLDFEINDTFINKLPIDILYENKLFSTY